MKTLVFFFEFGTCVSILLLKQSIDFESQTKCPPANQLNYFQNKYLTFEKMPFIGKFENYDKISMHDQNSNFPPKL